MLTVLTWRLPIFARTLGSLRFGSAEIERFRTFIDLPGDFREAAKATNVLSWPSQERAALEDGADPNPIDQAADDLSLGELNVIEFSKVSDETSRATRPDPVRL